MVADRQIFIYKVWLSNGLDNEGNPKEPSWRLEQVWAETPAEAEAELQALVDDPEFHHMKWEAVS